MIPPDSQPPFAINVKYDQAKLLKKYGPQVSQDLMKCDWPVIATVVSVDKDQWGSPRFKFYYDETPDRHFTGYLESFVPDEQGLVETGTRFWAFACYGRHWGEIIHNKVDKYDSQQGGLCLIST